MRWKALTIMFICTIAFILSLCMQPPRQHYRFHWVIQDQAAIQRLLYIRDVQAAKNYVKYLERTTAIPCTPDSITIINQDFGFNVIQINSGPHKGLVGFDLDTDHHTSNSQLTPRQ